MFVNQNSSTYQLIVNNPVRGNANLINIFQWHKILCPKYEKFSNSNLKMHFGNPKIGFVQDEIGEDAIKAQT